MKRLYVLACCCLISGLMPLVPPLPARAADASPAVVISEINWGGSARGIADEWFELANTSAEPADISGWSVTGVATGGGVITIPDGTTIPGFGTYLVANYDVGDNSTLMVTPDMTTTAVSLPNTKLTIALVMEDGTVVDSVTDAGTPDYGSPAAPFTSMERNLSTRAWQNGAQSFGLNDATQLGTPGSIIVPENSTEDATATADPTEPDVTAESDNIDALEEVSIIPEISTNDVSTTAPTPDGTTEKGVVEDVAREAPITTPDFVLDVSYTASDEAANATVQEVVTATATDPLPVSEVVIAAPVEVAIVSEPETTALVETMIVEATAVDAVVDDALPSPLPDAATSASSATSDESEPTTTDATTGSAAALTTGSIVLNEIVVTDTEWIEVRNADTHDIDVSAWTVRDASGKATTLGTFVLASGALLVVESPKGKLNNDGDTVELLNAEGTVVDAMTYGTDALDAPASGESLILTNNGWMITDVVTKGATNPTIAKENANDETATTITAQSSESSTTTYVAPAAPTSATITPNAAVTPLSSGTATTAVSDAVAKKTASSTRAKTSAVKASSSTRAKGTSVRKGVTTVTTLDDAPDGALVRYTGAVIAAPGTFGKQLLFLEGAQIYFSKALWPTLALGDLVTIGGEVSTARGERRIKVRDTASITVTGSLLQTPRDVVSLTEADVAHLVRITGDVSSRHGDEITLVVGSTSITVTAYNSSDIRWSALDGTHVTITGVVRHSADGPVLMPRSMDDITVLHDEVIAPAGTVPHFPTRGVVGGGILTSAAGMLGYWFVRSRTLIPQL